MPITAGTIVGNRYRLGRIVGQGGMQQVWASTDLSLERQVAVKFPIIEGARKRFAQSAQLSARVRHANVASALDYVADEDGEFFVEELIDGLNLQECIDRNFHRLDAETAARVLHHLAKGLAASHAANVLHRDLKPSNIMVSKDLSFSLIKITDFGIAKLAESELEKGRDEISSGKTQGLSSTMLGAIPFLAPEVLRKNKAGAPLIGKPSDVWSLAAIGYWLLSGEHPFGTGFEAVPDIFTANPKPWSPGLRLNKVTADLVQKLQGVIDQCFKIDPTERPTVDALVDQLSKLAYISAPRESGVISSKGDVGNYWWGHSSLGTTVMFPQPEVLAGTGILEAGARVSFISMPGKPYPRAMAILKLKKVE